MEAKKQRYQYNNYSTYGNTARKLQVMPGYEEADDVRPIRQPEKQKRSKPKQRLGIDLFSVLILTAAIAVTLYTLCSVIQQKMSPVTEKEVLV